ncbi:MAG: MarR family winged helix-turn-helix transcriptional regulator [Pseudomonadota bacterium]
MPSEPYLKTLRELARCYQAFEAYSAAYIRRLGLTPPQFDVIATLGNTPGMSFKELGEQTLITKGTLTGVIDRLEEKGLARRVASATDRRSTRVELTPAGDALFQRIFPGVVAHGRRAFGRLSPTELAELEAGLARLRAAFAAASQEENE